jgi:hypothetical protein
MATAKMALLSVGDHHVGHSRGRVDEELPWLVGVDMPCDGGACEEDMVASFFWDAGLLFVSGFRQAFGLVDRIFFIVDRGGLLWWLLGC